MLRCVPFAAVMLCFFLPMFSVSSCSDSGPTATATATGVDVVLGRTIHAQPAGPDDQSVADIQSQAQSVSHGVRPWAILTLILCALGIALSICVRQHHRLVNAGLSAVTLFAVINMWGAVNTPNAQAEDGLLLATLVLLLSLALQVCVFIWLSIARTRRSRRNPGVEGDRDPPGVRE